jgi:hypothetical protein
MSLQVPPALKADHEELHSQLAAATRAGGKVGEAAKAVAAVLHLHFVQEEEYALPPLGLLQKLAAGRVTGDLAEALAMSERVRRDLNRFLAEHRAIVAALKRLARAAKQEHREEYARLADKVILHAQTEEQVLYPATILIGKFLKLTLRERSSAKHRRRRQRV